jgi:hypothetical protein
MKLLFIGLDGLSFDTYREFDMPFLHALAAQGVEGKLISFEGRYMCTGPVWASVQTGLPPERHGITEPGAGTWHTAAYRRDVKTIWRRLNEQKVRCGVINFPVTYPVRPVEPFIVCGFPAPWQHPGTRNPWQQVDHGGEMFWPRELQAHVGGFRSAWMNYITPQEFADTHEPYRRSLAGDPAALEYFEALLYRSLRETARLAHTLLREHPVDLLACVFMETDTIGHLGAALPRLDRRAFLAEVDEVVREVYAAAGPQNVIVMSDHGCWGSAHTREGVFLAAGPAFAEAAQAEVEVLDVAPTILYLWDVYEPAMEREPAYRLLASGQVDGDETGRIQERLRAMGYLE